jgi:hypothetical protein
VKDVKDHKLENRMESFFLAETLKYLYLIFDKDNFLHNDISSNSYKIVKNQFGKSKLLFAYLKNLNYLVKVKKKKILFEMKKN